MEVCKYENIKLWMITLFCCFNSMLLIYFSEFIEMMRERWYWSQNIRSLYQNECVQIWCNKTVVAEQTEQSTNICFMNKYISLLCHSVRMGIAIALTFNMHVIERLVTLRIQGLFNIIGKFYPQNQHPIPRELRRTTLYTLHRESLGITLGLTVLISKRRKCMISVYTYTPSIFNLYMCFSKTHMESIPSVSLLQTILTPPQWRFSRDR